jgi:peroxiredoxin/predicted negative regulator of RcsB-dependent stress response
MIVIVLFLSLFLLISPGTYAISKPLGGMAPDFTLESLDGKKVSLSKFRGEIVVVLYWETGQDRSLRALKDNREISRNYKKKGVKIISLVADSEDKKEVQRIVNNNEIEFPVLFDLNRQVYSDYGVRVYPQTILIDREGKLAHDIPGHALIYSNTIDGYIRYMLGEINQAELKKIIYPHLERKDKPMIDAERKYNLALNFLERGFIDQAIETAKKSVDAKPDFVKSRILLGFLFLDKEEADMALEQFNRAIELNGSLHDAKTGFGAALVLKGDVDGGIEILEDAAVANPYPQMTYYKLGKAYERKGEKEKAMEMYKKAMDKITHKLILPSALAKCQ